MRGEKEVLMSDTARFITTYDREHATTLRVLRAFPKEQSEFKPAEKSNTAKHLAWIFVMEERMMLLALKGESILGSGFPAPPDSWDEILRRFEEQHVELKQQLAALGGNEMTGTVTFFVAPKTPGDYSTIDFVWFLLYDQIHHRGQMSVYLRMVGGKVPSIYGPTADEPWT